MRTNTLEYAYDKKVAIFVLQNETDLDFGFKQDRLLNRNFNQFYYVHVPLVYNLYFPV